jgi:hypothetical protein
MPGVYKFFDYLEWRLKEEGEGGGNQYVTPSKWKNKIEKEYSSHRNAFMKF